LAFADDAPASPAPEPPAGVAAESASRDSSSERANKLPSHQSGPPEEIWLAFFADNHASDEAVRRTVLRLTTLREHEHVIHLLQAALIHGQSQPWMYEVLADSMTVAGRPKEEVQRVVLSLTDFGSANLQSMMISGAYLTRFGRDEAALRMYRQASRMAPERPEPYIMALRLARKLKRADDVGWAAAGVLEHGWTADAVSLHREAENAALQAQEWLRHSGEDEAADHLEQSIADAKIRDLEIKVTWNGTADLDLLVEEPTGTVCSFESPETIGGGIHLHDGYGPTAANCVERYVCPRAVSGAYKLRVRYVFGDVVGNRAQVEITRHVGTPQQSTTRQTVMISDEDAVLSFTLENGRRDRPRTVSTRWLNPLRDREMVEAAQFLNRPGVLTPDEAQALRRFLVGRELSFQQVSNQVARPFVTGAVGFQPVVTTLNEGSILQASAVVSPDRRYVRLAVNPVFTTLTDVFTFSFVSGFDPFGGRNTGINGVGGN
jgi:hypothetical protein